MRYVYFSELHFHISDTVFGYTVLILGHEICQKWAIFLKFFSLKTFKKWKIIIASNIRHFMRVSPAMWVSVLHHICRFWLHILLISCWKYPDDLKNGWAHIWTTVSLKKSTCWYSSPRMIYILMGTHVWFTFTITF